MENLMKKKSRTSFRGIDNIKTNFNSNQKKDSFMEIKKDAIKTIGLGIFITFIIESYYIFYITGLTYFDIVINVSLAIIVFLFCTAYLLYKLENAEKELESMLNGKFGNASEKVVIEEYLSGIELSVFVLTDGKDYVNNSYYFTTMSASTWTNIHQIIRSKNCIFIMFNHQNTVS